MIDAVLNSSGDFSIVDGDIALTGLFPENDSDIATCIGQMAYFGLKTDLTDFTLHPEIGSEASKLLGMPNKPSTADAGKDILLRALKSMGINYAIAIDSWPEDINTIT